MKIKILAATLLFLGALPTATAQCDLPCLKKLVELANDFPSRVELESRFVDNLNTRLSLQPTARFKAWPSDPEVGRETAWKTAVWDNIKIHGDATQTETLESATPTGATPGQLTKFGLTGFKFIPSIWVAYEANVGQLITAWRQKRAGKNLRLGQKLYQNEELQKLRKAYADFEELRAEFLEAIAASEAQVRLTEAKVKVIQAKIKAAERCRDNAALCADEKSHKTAAVDIAAAEAEEAEVRAAATKAIVSSPFHKMKAKAIEVLSLVDYQDEALQHWLDARG